MADILTEVKNQLEAIDRRIVELDDREAKISKQELSLKTEWQSLATKVKELDEAAKTVDAGLRRIERADVLDQKEKELLHKQAELNKSLNQLKQWEDTLVEIETRQKADKEQLARDQAALSAEKTSYKETLKQEFLEEIAQKLR